MFLVYGLYDYVLGEKWVDTQLTNEPQPSQYQIKIVVPARTFIGLPFGGGFMKVARVYDKNGQTVRSKYYSEELKEEISRFKQTFTIPYFQLWKGMLYAVVAIAVVGVFMHFKNRAKMNELGDQQVNMKAQLTQVKEGQRYGVVFFTDKDGNSVDGLPEGWILIHKIEGDTLFVRRSKQTVPLHAVFEMKNIEPIKPASDGEWESRIEKVNYSSLKQQLDRPEKKRYDASYIGSDKEKYSGVCFTLQGAE